jgi:hypothetical protein
MQISDLNSEFNWRVVAKRKDIEGRRLEPVAIPTEPTPPLPPTVPASMRADRRVPVKFSTTP